MKQLDRSNEATRQQVQRRNVLMLMRDGVLSQPALALRTGLSSSTVHRLSKSMVEVGLVEQTGNISGSIGRPAALLSLNSRAIVSMVIRLVPGAMRSRQYGLDGELLGEKSEQWTNRYLDIEEVSDHISNFCESTGTCKQLFNIVIAVAGVVDNQGTVSQAPDLGWDEPVPLAKLLMARLHTAVSVQNDINLMARGALTDHDVSDRMTALFYVGTGIGGALLKGDTLVPGTNGAAGEIGLLPVSSQYGGLMRLEDKYAEPSLRRRLECTATEPVLSLLISRAKNNEDDAAYLNEVLDAWAFGLAALILVCDPVSLFLGGAAAELDDSTLKEITKRLVGIVPKPPPLILIADAEQAIFTGGVTYGQGDSIDRGLARLFNEE